MAGKKNRSRQTLNGLCLLVSGFGLGWLVGLSSSPVIQTILTSLIAVVVSISGAIAGLRPSDSDEGPDTLEEGEEEKNRSRSGRRPAAILLDPLPVMCMVVGLACGASAGVYARANGWLAARTNSYVAEWKDTGLTPQEITMRVFNSLYPPPGSEQPDLQEPAGVNPAGGEDSGGERPEAPAAEAQPARKGERRGAAPRPAAGPPVATERQLSFREGILFTGRLEQCKRLRNAEDEDELRREMASSNFEELVRLQRTCKDFACLRAGVSKVCAKYK